MERYQIPYAASQQVIGLLGGSFDPPHDGHIHITHAALKRLGLDAVWWLVSPGNPLKSRQPAPLNLRVERAKQLVAHPKVQVTGLEAKLQTRFTAETIIELQRLYPTVRFVWLMGADNLAQFHLWQDWREIMSRVPVGVFARPGDRISARMSKSARLYKGCRLKGRAAHLLGQTRPPVWTFVNLPMSQMSSTAIRAKGDWEG